MEKLRNLWAYLLDNNFHIIIAGVIIILVLIYFLFIRKKTGTATAPTLKNILTNTISIIIVAVITAKIFFTREKTITKKILKKNISDSNDKLKDLEDKKNNLKSEIVKKGGNIKDIEEEIENIERQKTSIKKEQKKISNDIDSVTEKLKNL